MEKLEPSYLAWWDVKECSALGNSLGIPQRWKVELPHDPGMPLLDKYPRELKAYVHIKTGIQMFIVALFIMVRKCKPPKCSSTDEWLNKM